jgi:hypothetical protein
MNRFTVEDIKRETVRALQAARARRVTRQSLASV